MQLNKHLFTPVIAFICLSCLLLACSTKKNTAGSRFWQAFNTRYNVYYNGSENYKEQLHDMETNYEDDYSQTIFMHPAEALGVPKATKPSGSFDRTIEKMQKAIQLHSIKKRPPKKTGKGAGDKKYKQWMSRDEYNPFIHNAWFLMGKAQYMKGDFLAAASTFHYIVRHFSWMPDLVTESQLWEVRAYCAMGWLSEADNLLAHVHPDKIKDKDTRAACDFAFADYYIKSKKFTQAIPYLAKAAKSAKGAQKVRLNFLLGQLYADAGDKTLAYKAFKTVGGASGASYRTQFNARIKQSAVFSGTNIKGEVRSLKSMVSLGRNKDYLDQIYYAIGNLFLSRKDTANAVSNYILAAQKSTRNGIDKAISQLQLGGIYFAQRKYAEAQPCYAEAVPLIPEDYPDYKLLKRRSDVLDELAIYAQNVKLQDSLLVLSKLSPAEQQKVADRLVADLKKKEKEEAENAKREEYLAQQAAKGNNNFTSKNSPQAPSSFSINNDKSWYFYNTATKDAGKTAFQKLWGSRRDEDNWRRRNKTSLASESTVEGESAATDSISTGANGKTDSLTKEQKLALKHSEDPHFPEYYLKQIPKTDEEIQNSNDIVQEGLYNMGVILKDKLEDFPSSIAEFADLLKRYPDNVYRLDTYYNLYLIYIRIGDVAMAEKYRSLIISDFADSKYGTAMKDPNYMDNLRNMNKVQEGIYAQAYSDYISNKNTAVHDAYAEMMRRYPMSKIMPKFMFIDALSYVTEKNYDKFKSTLKEMLERYPETDITPTASSILKQIAQGRTIHGGGTNVRGMFWSARLTNDTSKTDIEKKLTPFKDNRNSPQLYILVYPTDSVAPNQLLFDIAKHNFSTFVVKDFDLEQMTFGRLGLLIIKGFANFEELSHYRSVLEADKDLVIPPQVKPVMISVDNFNILINEGRSFEDYFNFLEQKNSEKVEKSAKPVSKEQPTAEPEAKADSAEVAPDSENTPATNAEKPAPAPRQGDTKAPGKKK